MCYATKAGKKLGLKMFYVLGLLGFCTKTGHENT